MDEISRLFACTGDGIWAVDADYRIVLWNSVAEELLGYTASEAVGQLCHELLKGCTAEGKPLCKAGCAVMEQARRRQPVRCFDLLIAERTGTVRRVNVSIVAVPAESDGHQVSALVHLFRPAQEGPGCPPSLRIRLLGRTEVQRADGSTVDGPLWRRAKVRALLAFLVLHRGQLVHRDAVIEALWPHLDYPAALRNLNTTVYNLRRSLEPSIRRGTESRYIRYEGDCYYLDGGAGHWVDVVAFETLVGQARRESNPRQAIALYREALTLYRGDFLADLLGHDLRWCWVEREWLRELYLMALEELGERCEQGQQEQEASSLYLKVLTLDPCRETAGRRLMRLALRRGDRAAAIAHYRRLADALWRELKVPPDRETQRLYRMALQDR
ncbi:MAG: PAS domain-containing protein [Chloroflexi bacterium]|nr:MAG: PAS domain-containing protein [Chloroflexota bacterium]